MKKKILTIFMSIAMMFSFAIVLFACGNPKPTGFTVYIGNNIVTSENNTLNFEYGETIDISSEIVVKVHFTTILKKLSHRAKKGTLTL